MKYRILGAALAATALSMFAASSAMAYFYPNGDDVTLGSVRITFTSQNMPGGSDTCTMSGGVFQNTSSSNFANFVTDPTFSSCTNSSVPTPTASGTWQIAAARNSTSGPTITIPMNGLAFYIPMFGPDCTNSTETLRLGGTSGWFNGLNSPFPNEASDFYFAAGTGSQLWGPSCWQNTTSMTVTPTAAWVTATDTTNPNSAALVG